MSMMRNAASRLALPTLLVLATAGVAGGQVGQATLAEQLRNGDRATRMTAAHSASLMSVEAIGPELRGALITALEREGRIKAEEWRGERERVDEPMLIARLALVVSRFGTPNTIEGLASAISTSPPATHALAQFGEPAAEAVLRLLTANPGAPATVISSGLIALRYIVELADERPLSLRTFERIRQQALDCLTSTSSHTVLGRAIDLAMVLDDPELRGIVQTLANDMDEVRARGITTPRYIEAVQERARDRLAGEPPQPRCCRSW